MYDMIGMGGRYDLIVQELTAPIKGYGTLWADITYLNNKTEET